MHAYDIALRIADEGRPALLELLRPYAVCAPGVVFDDGHVRVTAALVDHPPIEIALAYRFDTAHRSIVISGDTRPSANLIRLASEADVLVHEALYAPCIEGLLRRVPHAPRLAEHLLASHTRLEQLGRIAAAAGVRTLVLSHLTPSETLN
jgi:ribonuclease BN (tRNA processing enzyme)